MSNIIVSPTSGVIEFNTGDASGSAFHTSTAPIRLDATGGNTFFTGTNIGIGTSTPTGLLDINGVSYFRGGTTVGHIQNESDAPIIIEDDNYIHSQNAGTYLRRLIGKTSAGAIEIGESSTSIINAIRFYAGSSVNTSYTFYSGATELVRIDASGNVGIGTNVATPQYDKTLHIEGGNPTVRLETNSSAGWAYNQYVSPETTWSVGIDNLDRFVIANSAVLNSSLRLVIDDSNGNIDVAGNITANKFVADGTAASTFQNSSVGIGTVDTHFDLDVSGVIAAASGNFVSGITIGGNPVITGSSASEGDTLQTVTDRGATTTNNITLASSLPKLFFQDTDGTNQIAEISKAGSHLYFYNRDNVSNGGYIFIGDNGTTDTEFMRIASDGNVGIGTNNPDTKLHIKGTAIRFEEAGGSTRHFDIIPAVVGANHKFTSDSTVAGYEFYNNVNSLLNLTNTEAAFNTSGANIDFRVKSSGSTAIFVDGSNGAVGINQSSPSSTYALDVGGSIRMATAAPSLVLRETDSSNQEFSVFGLGGDFYVRDITQSTYPLKIEAGVATDTLVLESGGNVGIGTNNPTDFHSNANRLVVGDGAGNEGITIYAGASSAGSLYFADGTAGDAAYRGSIQYSHSAEKLFLGAGGGTQMTLTNTSLVGIGTQSPDKQLHISHATQPFLRLEESDSGGEKRLDLFVSSSTGVIAANQSAQTMMFQTVGTTRMTIEPGGDVGIGTDNPSTILDLNKANAISELTIRRDGSDPGTNTDIGGIQFKTDYSATPQDAGRILLKTNASAYRTDMKFSVRSTAGAEKIGMTLHGTVDSDPYLGIRTQTPVTELHVGGEGNATISGTGTCTEGADVFIYGSGNSDVINAVRARNDASIKVTSQTAGAYFRTNSATSTYNGLDLNQNWFIGQYGHNDLRIVDGTASAGDAAAAVTVQNSTKYVGIGQTSPQTILDVDGAVNHGIRIGSNNALIGEGGTTGTQLIFWNGTSAYYGRNIAPFTHTVSNHFFRVGGNDQMAVTSAGVGIGTNGLGTAKLQVQTDSLHTITSGLLIHNNVSTTGTAGHGVGIIMGREGGVYSSKIANVWTNNNPSYLQTNIAFYTMHDSFAPGSETEKMRLTSQGYLGIGTGSPRGKLDVVGNTDDDTDFLTIHDIDPSAGSHRPSIRFRSDSAQIGQIVALDNGMRFSVGTSETSHLEIRESTKHVGVGTGDPSYRLTVNSDNVNEVARFHSEDDDAMISISDNTDVVYVGHDASLDVMSLGFNSSMGVSSNLNIDVGGNVGIGTNNPLSNLDVKTQIRVRDSSSNDTHVLLDSNATDGRLRLNNGANWGLIARGFENSPAIGAYASGSLRVVGFSTSDGANIDSELVRFDFNNGRVGIGTASPDYTLTVDAGATNEIARFRSTDNDALISISDNTDTVYIGLDASADIMSLGFSNAFTTGNLSIDAGGQVGVGTTNPHSLLEVSNNSNDATLIVSSKTNATNGSYLRLIEAGTAFDTYGYLGGYIQYDCDGNLINIGRHNVNGTTLSDDAPAISIKRSDGKVGIGTTDPLGTTHIYTADAGGAIVTNASHDDLIIENNGNCGIQLSSPASSYQYLAFGDTASANAGYVRYYHDDDSMVLRAGANDTVTIKGSSVGIGTNAPSYELDVVGTTRSTYYIGGAYFEENASSSKIKFYPNGTVLVMDEDGELKPCEKENDTLVFGVSKRDFEQPIVLGAEPILVTGPIKVGDYIVTSNKQGHGQAMKEQNLGTIIAQAMENGDGESYNIKAMIRKM